MHSNTDHSDHIQRLFRSDVTEFLQQWEGKPALGPIINNFSDILGISRSTWHANHTISTGHCLKISESPSRCFMSESTTVVCLKRGQEIDITCIVSIPPCAKVRYFVFQTQGVLFFFDSQQSFHSKCSAAPAG